MPGTPLSDIHSAVGKPSVSTPATGSTSISERRSRGLASRSPVEPSPEMVTISRVELERLRNMATLGELLSTTTHEFNNLLTTILNYAKLGMRQEGPMREKALTKILAAGQRAAKVTATILASARNRSESFEPTDLKEVLDGVLVLLERELTKYRVSLELELADVPAVRARGNQIQQVLMNLLTNARQAMPDGGRCLIRLSHDPAAGMVDLVVRDTGRGIPAETLPKIFDPFFSTKAGPDETGKGGTGVGLSHCRDVIEAHQGRIRVESSVGKGTAFTLRLPVDPSARAA